MSEPPSEIVLPPSSTFPLEAITDPSCREQFLSTLRPLDSRSLGRMELDQLMDTMKLVMMAFGQKMVALETEMSLREARLENRLLQQDQEIRQLHSELQIMRLERELDSTKEELKSNKMDKVIKLAKAMEGDEYRPYAVKQALKACKDDSGLPDDYKYRLAKAQKDGFKWRNNITPAKDSKKLEKLVEWEESFDSVESLTLDQLLDQDYVFVLGKGAESAALLKLQELLKINLIKKFPRSTRHNLYQKAVKIALERGFSEKDTSEHEAFVGLYWGDQEEGIKKAIEKLFDERGVTEKTFKLCTTQKIQPSPHAFPYEEGDIGEVERWMGIRDGKYDPIIREIIKSYSESSPQ